MSIKNVLYVLWYAKRYFSGLSNTEQLKIKPVALAIIELHLCGGFSQSISRTNF